MADKKISELTETTTGLDTMQLFVNDEGVSKRITRANLISGAVSAATTTYSMKAGTQIGGAGLELDAGGAGTGTDTVKLMESGSATVVRTDADTITIGATNTTYVDATTSVAGLMSTGDKTKIDGVATSANNYTHPNHSGDVVSTNDGATTIQVGAVDLAMLSATGTASSTTFLRGDNAWTALGTSATLDVGTSASQIVQLNGSAELPAVSGANLTNLPSGGATALNGLSDCTVSASDPATDTNPSAGHLWLNKTSGEMYTCTDATADLNIWTNVGDGDGSIQLMWYGDRGVFGGGEVSGATQNVIDYITISSAGNATDFGDLTLSREKGGACSNGSRGVFGAGNGGTGANTTIDYITISSAGNATDFGDTTVGSYGYGTCSSITRGLFGGGWVSGVGASNHIDYITIASTGNATDFGDLTVSRSLLKACADGDRGVFAGGYDALNHIDYVTIASTGNATDFGDLTVGNSMMASCSDDTRGVFAGGFNTLNHIDYITIASTGNATDFGDLTVGRHTAGGTANGTIGVFGGGSAGGALSASIDYITIATTGNAADFGDLTIGRVDPAATSGN
jgi:hypothetical protein